MALGRMKALVSIVITTFNRADMVSRAIRSALAQTLKDIEILVIDDGSTDGTQDVVGSFDDPRIRYLRSEENRGAVWAANRGITEASSELVAFLDSDDEARPRWAEKLWEAFQEEAQVGMAWPFKAWWGPDGEFLGLSESRDLLGKRPKSLVPIMARWTPGWGGVMFRRAVFDRIGMCDPQVSAVSDRDFALRFAVDGTWGFRVVREVLYDVHCHGGSHHASARDPAYASHVEAFLRKHETVFAGLPRIHGMWLYKLARAYYAAGLESDGDRCLVASVRRWPLAAKPLAYLMTRKLGVEGAWQRAAALLADLRTIAANRGRNPV